MILKIHPSRMDIDGRVTAPPSKSYTHRALFAALLACGTSIIWNPLYSGDTEASMRAVEKLGGRIAGSGGRLQINGVCGDPRPPAWIDCSGSGTTLRIATAVSSLVGEPVLLYGDSTLRRRPMKPLLESLRELGVETVSRNGYPPIVVKGPPKPGEVKIDASISSQYLTALLFISPIIGIVVESSGQVASKPYIDMTIRVLEEFGVVFERRGYDWFAPLSDAYEPTAFNVPGDYSSASFIMALGAIAGRVRVEGLDTGDVQPDKRIISVLKDMGANVKVGEGFVEVESIGGLEGVNVNLRDSPDLAPVIAALAAHANGTTIIEGISHLAFKESDRIQSITMSLRSIGVKAVASDGRIIIEGGVVKGGEASSFNDHRIAMMLAVTAVKARAPVVIHGGERIRDSYPFFIQHLRQLGVGVEVVQG